MTNPAASNHNLESRNERGQTMAEYSVVIALITLAIVGAFTLMNNAVLGMLGRVAGYLGN
jgi:Flp pilus assembly pilin Flp